ncbi:MAG TPA: putative lipopolysaccharide heptosyltransferase III [Methylomusa anaerophila]|uniref:lipopolysaccharide heptosyltransferase II n=1 Tax=Methylomusa anaerophila TaxID=1930071 RepID=A0A348AKK0_9FIRM|nr:putative lipopolysaccharide heptosyltransferase III [Methylomusa anaerophila]BBB91598.1 lipopolysaccharide core heptosyltransferase RfaQ [Methylomusa anaerophila]HML89464.1 putative lipopolysaccharide heptosyltransferase III [Methylomusa anaerophila]
MVFSITKILIINLAFIGDVLLSTPVARALREKYPAAQIDMLVIPLTEPIASGNPYVDKVIVYDKRGKHKKIGELWKLIAAVRREKYDLAVCTNFASRGAILAWAAGIRKRAGYDAQHAGWFLTDTAPAKHTALRHEAENYLDVLKPLGISTGDTSLALTVRSQDAQSLREKIQRDWRKPLVLICPSGSYDKKSWLTEGYAALIESIVPLADCYLIGGKAEQAKLDAINARAGNQAVVLAGTLTLGELAALISVAELLITVDTGPMHIACAVGTPVAAFFGPTDPRIWGPRGDRDIIFQTAVDCFPCWGRKECSHHRCMRDIKQEEVIVAVSGMLNSIRHKEQKYENSHF